MLKLLFLTIILYIIIQHLMDETDDNQSNKIQDEKSSTPKKGLEQKPKINPINSYETSKAETPFAKPEPRVNDVKNRAGTVANIQVPKIIAEGRIVSESRPVNKQQLANTREPFADRPQLVEEPQVEEVVYDKPNPWSKIIIDQRQEYPYLFHIKVKIPSLNDFENWKQIIPNIGFDPRTGELIIPSKDEASAIALANLIVINFGGQISLKDILEKNLIQISVAKAKSYDVVQNKLREQIMENLYGKQFNASQTSFEKDLAKKNEPFVNTNNMQQNNGRVDFTSEAFTDTFEHFSDNANNEENGIEAWDGNDFSFF